MTDAVRWLLQIALAAIYLVVGSLKLSRPRDQVVIQLGWAADLQPATIRAIGWVEVLGAVGLIVPATAGLAPILTPMTAVGLCALQLGALALHVRRRETWMLPLNLLLCAAAALVAATGVTVYL